MVRLLALALILPLVALLTACSGAAPTAESVAAQPKRASAAPATQVAAQPPANPICTDRKGDGHGFDIRKVELTRVGSHERVAVTVAKVPDFAAHDTADAILSFFDHTGNNGGMFTTKWIGSEIAVSVFDIDGAHNSAVPTTPVVSGNTITTTYPADLIDRFAGKKWVWQATTTLDGDDADYCSNAEWEASVS